MSWYSDYIKSLKLPEVEEVLDLFFYRPLAFLLVKAVYNTRVAPNHLTIFSILMGISAGCCYAVGRPEYFTIGALLYLAFNIFDCADGQLARLKKNGTHTGRIIDGIADTIATVAVYIGIALGFANKSDNPLFWWLMLGLTGFSNIVHGVLVDYYRNRFLDYVLERKKTFEEGIAGFEQEYKLIKDEKKKWFDKAVIYIYLKYSTFQRTVVAKKKITKPIVATPEEYFKINKLIIRFWIILGPSTQITTLILCSLFHRFDIYVWIMVVGFNLLALILWLIQHIIDRKLKSNHKS